jgi:hypothetical protein
LTISFGAQIAKPGLVGLKSGQNEGAGSMKRHITFFVTVVISWSAQADPAKPISWEEAKATQGFLPNAVLEAGDKVEFLSTGSACSGQFISSTGVYLTAMHCLMKSIMNEGPKLRIESGDSPPHFKAWSVQDPSQLPFQTRAVPDSWYLRAMNEPNEPKVLALGGGFFEFPPNISSFSEFDLIQKKTADFAKFQEDYGILKFELEKPESHHCLKISKSDPSSEEEVWAIGYPDEFIGTNQEPKKFVTKTKVFLTLHELKASTKIGGVDGTRTRGLPRDRRTL